jgi:hypothetical protein
MRFWRGIGSAFDGQLWTRVLTVLGRLWSGMMLLKLERVATMEVVELAVMPI